MTPPRSNAERCCMTLSMLALLLTLGAPSQVRRRLGRKPGTHLLFSQAPLSRANCPRSIAWRAHKQSQRSHALILAWDNRRSARLAKSEVAAEDKQTRLHSSALAVESAQVRPSFNELPWLGSAPTCGFVLVSSRGFEIESFATPHISRKSVKLCQPCRDMCQPRDFRHSDASAVGHSTRWANEKDKQL
jgi:hypothetical protein